VPNFPAKLDTETPRAYEAFMAWCALDSGRSLAKLSQDSGKHITLYEQWSRKHSWVARVARYDAAVSRERAAQLDAARRADVERLRVQSQQDAAVLRGLALRAAKVLDARLKSLAPEGVEPQQIAGLLRGVAAGLDTAANLDAAALGVADVLRYLETLADGDADTDEPGATAQSVGG